MDNPYTRGQCGGMCATWLANMWGRVTQPSLAATIPHSRGAIDTHLAGLRVPAAMWPATPEGRRQRPNISQLPIDEANQRYAAAAGLKPGPVRGGYFMQLGKGLAQSAHSVGYFIDIGGHAVATFVNGKTFAPYESRKRLYYFDPGHGCSYSEDESSFEAKFLEAVNEHKDRNPAFNLNRWSYFKVSDMRHVSDEDADMGVSSLFG
jgi:hypothetical protein